MSVTITIRPEVGFLKTNIRLFRVSDSGGKFFDHVFKRFDDAEKEANERKEAYWKLNHTIIISGCHET